MNQAQQFPEGTFLGRAALSSLVEAYRGLYREPSDSLHFTPKPDLYRACFLAEGTGDHLADLKHILKYKAYLETGEDDESIPFPLEAYLSGPTWEDKMRHADNKGLLDNLPTMTYAERRELLHGIVNGEMEGYERLVRESDPASELLTEMRKYSGIFMPAAAPLIARYLGDNLAVMTFCPVVDKWVVRFAWCDGQGNLGHQPADLAAFGPLDDLPGVFVPDGLSTGFVILEDAQALHNVVHLGDAVQLMVVDAANNECTWLSLRAHAQ